VSTEPHLPPDRPAQDPAQWFAQEVHPYGQKLKAYVHGSFPTLRGEADDLVQESFLRIWKIRSTQPIASAKAFLFRIAHNLALDTVRRKRRSPIDPVAEWQAIGAAEDSPGIAVRLGQQEKIEVLTDIVAALPPRRREIIILCKFEQLSAQAAADRLGRTRRAVENELARGIREVRERLQARGIDSLYQ
jgi:RNA polymerase sigma factor (sigma-70 family)